MQPPSSNISSQHGRPREDEKLLPSLKKPVPSSPCSPVVADGSVIIARTVNIALEGIFCVTLRKENDQQYKYVGYVCSGEEFLSSSNISDIICARLGGDCEVGGGAGYLLTCFKRLHNKLTTVTNERVKEELLRYS